MKLGPLGRVAGLDMPRERYGAIMMDAPWSFATFGGKRTTPHRGAAEPYSVLPRLDLESLPIADLAAKDCALFMWCVSSHLDEAIDLMRSWGFRYKSLAFVWVKTARDGSPRMGMGYWTRQQAEICIVGTKGKPPVRDHGVRQVIMAPKREHSRKPDEVADRVRDLVGGPFLEMFGRQPRFGWTVWGDEVDKFSPAG